MVKRAGVLVVVGLFLCAAPAQGAVTVHTAKAKIGRDTARTARSLHTGWAVGSCQRQAHRVVCAVRLRGIAMFAGGDLSDCVQHVAAYERRGRVVLRDLDVIDCTKPPT